MDTALLEVFQEVARRGSFTGAAEALGYTQSAVSRQISTLEGQVGAALFDRLPRGVRLTEEGRCLLPHASAITDRLRTARGDLRALRDLAAGRLRVGAFATADVALVPQAMAAFRAAHPRVSVSLVEGLTRRLLARLGAGELDLAIVAADDAGEFEGLRLRHLLDDPMFVAVHPDHRLARRAEVRLAELADEDWIAGRSRPEETLMSAAPQPGFRPRITYVVGEWIAKQGLVAAGLGVTLIPSLAAGAARPDIVLVPLHPDDAPVRRVYAATPAGVTAPPALTAFLGLLEEAVVRLRERTTRAERPA
ncbi:LysR family transcriptional regulator [Actinoallomurus rhizosphaericola]|uniref:LysR family transcriptional regulator n=1 Tax=Actinoallomurus rhizosphaericola TaxID=2952536 RepID=UPI002091D178|nr:LysR family transcriptional regulator [Actinoallomurus rhizosphaericola]MCO5994047.1 LysR substrate-binding domain-containing protein [Actinoallomurus rhizosphaericola]